MAQQTAGDLMRFKKIRSHIIHLVRFRFAACRVDVFIYVSCVTDGGRTGRGHVRVSWLWNQVTGR
jgi:hypothetical protein